MYVSLRFFKYLCEKLFETICHVDVHSFNSCPFKFASLQPCSSDFAADIATPVAPYYSGNYQMMNKTSWKQQQDVNCAAPMLIWGP